MRIEGGGSDPIHAMDGMKGTDGIKGTTDMSATHHVAPDTTWSADAGLLSRLFRERFSPPWHRSLTRAVVLTCLFSAVQSPRPTVAANDDSNVRSTSVRGDLQYARNLSRAFREVARAAQASVVSITCIDRPPFSQTFGRSTVQPRMPSPLAPQRTPRSGQGTGVIYTTDGLIVTNHHVVDGADEVLVRFDDGRELPARVVGTDPETDLAVVRVDATGLVAAQLDTSDSIDTGDWVLAIGCPFGLRQTVTAGIVSAKGRDGVGLSTLEEYIQTDAAINPGNSGGPLVNLDGKVVGINSGIASRDGGNMGVGFAIPAHVVQRIASAIASGTPIRRGWLGVSMQELDRDLAASFGHSSNSGVLVSAVLPNTPAARAGIESGDIIIAVDGAPTATPSTMMRMIATRDPQSRVTLALLRAGERVEVQAQLGERPSQGRAEPSDDTENPPSAEEKLGIEVQDLDAETAAALKTQQPGVVIASTLDGGPGAQAGLQPGDVIREVNGTSVRTVAQLQSMLERAGARGMVRILVEREGSTRFTMVKPMP